MRQFPRDPPTRTRRGGKHLPLAQHLLDDEGLPPAVEDGFRDFTCVKIVPHVAGATLWLVPDLPFPNEGPEIRAGGLRGGPGEPRYIATLHHFVNLTAGHADGRSKGIKDESTAYLFWWSEDLRRPSHYSTYWSIKKGMDESHMYLSKCPTPHLSVTVLESRFAYLRPT